MREDVRWSPRCRNGRDLSCACCVNSVNPSHRSHEASFRGGTEKGGRTHRWGKHDDLVSGSIDANHKLPTIYDFTLPRTDLIVLFPMMTSPKAPPVVLICAMLARCRAPRSSERHVTSPWHSRVAMTPAAEVACGDLACQRFWGLLVEHHPVE